MPCQKEKGHPCTACGCCSLVLRLILLFYKEGGLVQAKMEARPAHISRKTAIFGRCFWVHFLTGGCLGPPRAFNQPLRRSPMKSHARAGAIEVRFFTPRRPYLHVHGGGVLPFPPPPLAQALCAQCQRMHMQGQSSSRSSPARRKAQGFVLAMPRPSLLHARRAHVRGAYPHPRPPSSSPTPPHPHTTHRATAAVVFPLVCAFGRR